MGIGWFVDAYINVAIVPQANACADFILMALAVNEDDEDDLRGNADRPPGIGLVSVVI